MKYKFLYDNLKENDIVDFKEEQVDTITRVYQIKCNCNPGHWNEHFHTIAGYICEYDPRKNWDHTNRVKSIWRYKDKNTLVKVAAYHPRKKEWVSAEEMTPFVLTDTDKLKTAIKNIQEYLNDIGEQLK